MSDTESEQQTIEQFISEHGLTMTSEPVPENPNMSGGMPEGAQHYYCVVTAESGEESLSTYYSVGPGIVERHAVKRLSIADRKFFARAPKTIYAQESIAKHRKSYRPDLRDLLDCLASDCCGSDESFEDWAANYGYDEDSRKAENTYHIIRKQARELRQLLGAEAYEVLIYQTERL